MKKWLCLVASTLLVAAVLLAGCRASEDKPIPTPVAGLTEEYIRGLPLLCPKEEIKDIDFTVLKDVDYIIRNYSVFTSPVFRDTFGETSKDQAYLMRAARDTLFQGFLSVPQNQIPQWAIDWVEEEINSGRYDYNVFNRIYQELLKDARYKHLGDSGQKEKLLKIMIEGIIKALGDPFTAYFDREHWIISEHGSSAGTYRGMGINLGKNERGEVSMSGVSKGSPAEKAGLLPGDAILAVDEKSVLDCSVAQFSMHVKTRQNPEMELIIRRKLTDKIERVRIVLEAIKIRELFTGPGVDLPDNRGSTAENLPFYYPLRDREGKEHPEILYVQIKEFTGQVAEDLYYALSNLDMEKFKGIIVDVRENPGGAINVIFHCADFFLPGDQTITITKEIATHDQYGNIMPVKNGITTEYRQNRWNLIPDNIPVAILVGQNSYSGAELFPSALRDNGRAVIISKDESTGGKGSVNTHFALRKGEYGALYVSIGLWYTPSGQMIEKMDLDRDGYYEIGGLKPDIKVDWTDEDIIENQRRPAYHDPTIFKAIEWLQENYPWKPKK